MEAFSATQLFTSVSRSQKFVHKFCHIQFPPPTKTWKTSTKSVSMKNSCPLKKHFNHPVVALPGWGLSYIHFSERVIHFTFINWNPLKQISKNYIPIASMKNCAQKIAWCTLHTDASSRCFVVAEIFVSETFPRLKTWSFKHNPKNRAQKGYS